MVRDTYLEGLSCRSLVLCIGSNITICMYRRRNLEMWINLFLQLYRFQRRDRSHDRKWFLCVLFEKKNYSPINSTTSVARRISRYDSRPAIIVMSRLHRRYVHFSFILLCKIQEERHFHCSTVHFKFGLVNTTQLRIAYLLIDIRWISDRN